MVSVESGRYTVLKNCNTYSNLNNILPFFNICIFKRAQDSPFVQKSIWVSVFLLDRRERNLWGERQGLGRRTCSSSHDTRASTVGGSDSAAAARPVRAFMACSTRRDGNPISTNSATTGEGGSAAPGTISFSCGVLSGTSEDSGKILESFDLIVESVPNDLIVSSPKENHSEHLHSFPFGGISNLSTTTCARAVQNFPGGRYTYLLYGNNFPQQGGLVGRVNLLLG